MAKIAELATADTSTELGKQNALREIVNKINEIIRALNELLPD